MTQQQTINIRRLMKMLQGAARSGVDLPSVLAQCGVAPSLLNAPDARVEPEVFVRLMSRIMEQTQDEFLGLGQGRRSKPGTFSMMAQSVIHCPDLQSAVERGIRFYDLFDLSVGSRLLRQGKAARLMVHADPRLDFRDVIVEAVLLLSVRFMGWLIGKRIELDAVHLDYPPQRGDEEYHSLFGCAVTCRSEFNGLIFASGYLELPLLQDELSLSAFLPDALARLFDGNAHDVGLPARIRAIIGDWGGPHFPAFDEVCEALHMTPPTLRRRLRDSNSSYREIVDAIRKDRALHYLSTTQLGIAEVALLTGFSETSSFYRAFRKWTQQTPTAYRREHCGLAPEG